MWFLQPNWCDLTQRVRSRTIQGARRLQTVKYAERVCCSGKYHQGWSSNQMFTKKVQVRFDLNTEIWITSGLTTLGDRGLEKVKKVKVKLFKEFDWQICSFLRTTVTSKNESVHKEIWLTISDKLFEILLIIKTKTRQVTQWILTLSNFSSTTYNKNRLKHTWSTSKSLSDNASQIFLCTLWVFISGFGIV